MDGNYVVLAVALIVWIGLFLYVLGLDRRMKKMESKRR